MLHREEPEHLLHCKHGQIVVAWCKDDVLDRALGYSFIELPKSLSIKQ